MEAVGVFDFFLQQHRETVEDLVTDLVTVLLIDKTIRFESNEKHLDRLVGVYLCFNVLEEYESIVKLGYRADTRCGALEVKEEAQRNVSHYRTVKHNVDIN